MSHSPYDVFISYRRAGGSALAELVRSALVQRGFRVFMDVRELSAGPFDASLKKSIESSQNFVVLLTPGCLDRCSDERDWLRQEITVALNAKRQIVPLKTEDFQFPPPQRLPKAAALLTRHHCVTYVHEHGEASLDKLCGLLQRGKRPLPMRRTAALAVGLLLLLAIGGGLIYYFSRRADATVREPIPAPLRPEPIDIMSLIDVNRDQKTGAWLGNPSMVIGKGGERGFYLVLPWDPPPEYRLHLRAMRLSADKSPLFLGLSSGAKRFVLAIDVDGDSPHTGLSLLDGRKTKGRSDLRKGRVMARGVPMELVVSVRQDSVQLESSGSLIYKWSGDLSRASRSFGPLNAPLYIGGRNGGFEFEKILLEPLGNDRGQLLDGHGVPD